MSTYRLTTLGPVPRLVRTADGHECVRFSKQLGVLAYLTSRPQAKATRDELVGLLWTTSSQQDGRRALRQVVYQIRQATDRDFLRGDEKLSLRRDDIVVDADVFRQNLAAGDLDGALAIYERDFLSGVDLAGALEFEHWAEGVRALLAAERRQLLRTLIARESDAGQWAAAAQHAEQLISADPASLEGRLRLIELHALSGDAVRAQAAAEEARDVAAEVAGRRRSHRLDESIDRALAATRAPERRRTNGFPRNPEMVGRAEQFHAVVERWKAALEGRGGAVLITGEAGIGKTRLVRELARRFSQDRALAVETACYAVEQSDPLGPFLEALRKANAAPGLAGATPASLEVLGALVPEIAERFRPTLKPRTLPLPAQAIEAALLDGLGAVAHEAPCALLVDDLHWAVPGTIEFAHRLARHARDHALLVVLSARDQGPAADTMRDLRALALSPAVLEVPLAPLDEGDVTNLLGSIAELPPEVAGCCLAEQLVSHTEGIPLYIIEALKELHDTGYLTVRDGRWALSEAALHNSSDLPLPETAADVLRTRLQGVGGTPFDVLVAMAVWGREATRDTLARITGLTPPSVAEAVAALERRRLVSSRGTMVVIAHDEIAERVREIAPAELVSRSQLKAAAAAADLAVQGRTSEWVVAARHAAAAGRAGAATDLAGYAAGEAERVAGPEAGRDTIRRVLDAAGDQVRGELEESFRRVLSGSWSVRRWRAERDGTAGRRRTRLAAGVGTAAVVATLGVVSFLHGRTRPAPLGDGYIALSWGNVQQRQDTVIALRLDSQYTPTRVPNDSLPPGVREGFAAMNVEPGAGAGVMNCALPRVDPTALCIRRTGRSELEAFFRYEGDAEPHGWLPDGAGLIVTGGYLSPVSGYSYAVLLVDSAGSLLRTIARDSFDYGVMALSPAGDRILVSRRLRGRQETVLMGLDGTVTGRVDWCTHGPASWSPDGTTLACLGRDDHALALGRAAPGFDHAVVPLEGAGLSAPAWSPDGRYAAIGVFGTNAGVYVIDVAANREPRRVLPLYGRDLRISWVPTTPTPRMKRIEVLRESVTVAAGRRAQLEAVGRDDEGRPVTGLRDLEWLSLDPEVARVVGSGTVAADRPGVARIVVARGLTQADTTRVFVPATTPRRVLDETFDRGLDTVVWRRFGYPAPRVLPHVGRDGSRAFHNNGDYSHTSGIALRRSLPLGRGLTVEYWARVPIRYRLWEDVTIALRSGPADSFALGQGDPLPVGSRDLVVARFPNPDDARDQMLAQLFGDAGLSQTTLPLRLRDGRWHRYRLVIYPTGEVRWFADGEEIVPPAAAHVHAGETWTLTVEGNSYRTLALVDDITAWEGVVLDSMNPERTAHRPTPRR